MAVGADRKMPVFGRLNDRGVESCEVEEGMNKMKGGKAPGLDQCAEKILKKGERSMVAWLVRLFSCCFESERVPGDWCTELSRTIREKVTDASAVTTGA